MKTFRAKAMIKRIFQTLSIMLLGYGTAHAYIDPGTGSLIVQAIIGSVVAGMTFIGLYFQKFKDFLARITGNNKTENETVSTSDD